MPSIQENFKNPSLTFKNTETEVNNFNEKINSFIVMTKG